MPGGPVFCGHVSDHAPHARVPASPAGGVSTLPRQRRPLILDTTPKTAKIGGLEFRTTFSVQRNPRCAHISTGAHRRLACHAHKVPLLDTGQGASLGRSKAAVGPQRAPSTLARHRGGANPYGRRMTTTCERPQKACDRRDTCKREEGSHGKHTCAHHCL